MTSLSARSVSMSCAVERSLQIHAQKTTFGDHKLDDRPTQTLSTVWRSESKWGFSMWNKSLPLTIASCNAPVMEC